MNKENIKAFRNIDKLSKEEADSLMLEYEVLKLEQMKTIVDTYTQLASTGQHFSRDWVKKNIIGDNSEDAFEKIQAKIDKLVIEIRNKKIDNITDED